MVVTLSDSSIKKPSTMDLNFQDETIKEEFLDYTEETDTECASVESVELPLKTALSDEQLFELIREYEARPCLWIKNQKNFSKNRKEKRKAIYEIAKNFNIPEKVIRGKLRNLRTVFFQNLQKTKKWNRSSGGRQQPKWKFFNALSFLISEPSISNEDDQAINTASICSSATTGDCSAVEQLPSNLLIKNLENPAINSVSICSSATSVDSNAVEPHASSLFISNIESYASTFPTVTKSHESNKFVSKNRKRTHAEETLERYPTLLSHLRPQTNHEEFLSYVRLTLAQIKDENLIKRAKCQIQLVLTKVLAKHAERELAIIESEENYNGNFNACE